MKILTPGGSYAHPKLSIEITVCGESDTKELTRIITELVSGDLADFLKSLTVAESEVSTKLLEKHKRFSRVKRNYVQF
jgi:hypothetical protein